MELDEDEAVQAAIASLVEAHLVHPDWAYAVARCAVRAAAPKLWYRLRLRVDHLKEELGLPNSLPGG